MKISENKLVILQYKLSVKTENGEIQHIIRGYETPKIYFKELDANIKRIKI